MKRLADYTVARVDLGRAGQSVPTKPLLDFRLAHARARDSVQFPLDTFSLSHDFAQANWPAINLRSSARTREEYLRRPDLGRTLSEASIAELSNVGGSRRFVFVVADGLSALAVHRYAAPLLRETFPLVRFAPDGGNPILIVQQARVAIGDHIGALLGADMAVVIIGERPGLTVPDSLGIYLTWQPKPGRTDAERNCISNIQPHGLSCELAAHKLAFLMNESRRRELSGVGLKETASKLIT